MRLPNPNPNPKPGFDLSQTRKPGFTEGTRVWKLYGIELTEARDSSRHLNV